MYSMHVVYVLHDMQVMYPMFFFTERVLCILCYTHTFFAQTINHDMDAEAGERVWVAIRPHPRRPDRVALETPVPSVKP